VRKTAPRLISVSNHIRRPSARSQCLGTASPNPTAAARSNCSTHPATAAPHGFKIDILVEMINTGLATTTTEHMVRRASGQSHPNANHSVDQNCERLTWHLPLELGEIARDHCYVEASEDRFLWFAVEEEPEAASRQRSGVCLPAVSRSHISCDIVTW
jgi:hypothetical protein